MLPKIYTNEGHWDTVDFSRMTKCKECIGYTVYCSEKRSYMRVAADLTAQSLHLIKLKATVSNK